MERCSSCSKVNEIYETGTIELQVINQIIDSIVNVISKSNVVFDSGLAYVRFQYSSIEELTTILARIDIMFNEETKVKMNCRILPSQPSPEVVSAVTSFSELKERMNNRQYVKIINDQLFTSFIQPIVTLDRLDVYGYEFLLRPEKNQADFLPGDLFAFSKRAGLQSLLDSQARISSIEKSARHLKRGIKRFINFLPSSIYDPNHCLKSTFAAVEKYDVEPTDLVFEVVETEQIMNMTHLKNIFDVYKKHGMKVALDDLGAGYATLEVLKQLQPNYAKVDRSIIDRCDQDVGKQKMIIDIVKIAMEYNIILLAEGIERSEEADFCKSVGIPLAQGYFFAPPGPLPLEELKLTRL
ncbi:EAL domain-containing protein (plasmid) [Anaerobacillus sp. CMMVII]|uniref:EAL domain-containing protein n=1 Tax=Anaerobacillus sp. CMMVII TaxID=2755588 RepID=UPI0021B77572|nr:EAL domain-containing protein [Anaerobacillus sp. CMMVII]MCT8139229.1 EAL domain-containing protein [Anaerobacillus sp. CMMVII]